MKAQNIIYGLVALTIAVIITVSAVVPIFMDTTKTTDTFTNDGYFRMTSIESTEDGTITFVWDHTTPEVATVNDIDIPITYPTMTNPSISLMFSDTFTIRFFKDSSGISCQAFLPNGAYVSASVTNGTDLIATATSGTVSVVNTAGTPATGSATYDTLYYMDNSGEFTMKKSDVPAYVFPDSTIVVANGLTSVGMSVIGVYFEGNIEDGYDFTIYRGTATESNVTSVYTEQSKYVDLVTLDKVTFTLTKDADSTNAVYSYFLVPYEITAERSIHPDGPTSTIINLVPLIIVAGILLLAIVYFIRRA